MPSVRRALCGLLLMPALLVAGQAPREITTVELLDRYAAGAFDDVVRHLSGEADFNEILKQLRRDGPAWIAAAGPEQRDRRRIAAATVALEAARADAWREWKWIVKPPLPDPLLNTLVWKPPPLLIEWACTLLRQDPVPSPIERWWQLAALAVAQRAEDPAFLVGDPSIGRGAAAGEIMNLQDEIKHLDHVVTRFPDEARFMLGQGIARDRVWPDDAEQAYQAILDHPDVGGEAAMRLGAMWMRLRRDGDALRMFERSRTLTRDPYVVYLAHYFSGRIHEGRKDRERAAAAYRGAVAAMPRAQSATFALASLAFQDGRRGEANALVRDAFAADPPPADPWRAFVHADDRFWPQLVGWLRAEIAR